MTSTDVANLVRQQVENRRNEGYPHGVTFDRCLVPPTFIIAMESVPGNAAEETPVLLWVVLEEDPDNRTGYKVVFDESHGGFGLALSRPHGLCPFYLGIYGSFLDALEAM